MLKNISFLALIIFSYSNVSAFEKQVFYDHSGKELLEISADLIKTPSGRILYHTQGNIVFQGTGERRKDILLMLNSENIFAKKGGQVQGQLEKQNIYYTFGGGFYIRPSDKTIETQLLAYWQKEEDGTFSLFDGENDSLLAYFPFGDASDITLTILFHYYQISNGMAEKLIAKYVPLEKESRDVSASSGTIRRMWGGGNDEFEWDGFVLKRKWSNNTMQEWTFDGYILKRVWSSNGNEEMIWEDNVLRRRWYVSKDEFIWNGRTIRRRYGSQEEYIVQGSIVKSLWSESDVNQWEIDGDLPIPIIAMVIYGLISR